MKLVGNSTAIWWGLKKDSIHSEAPHIYKKNNFYYLLTAEGGTHHTHCVAIAKSELLTGPFKGNPSNPILTHRHLGYETKIGHVGHGDLVQDFNGQWWMTSLGVRFNGGYHFNTGRETFISPVNWDSDWPFVNPRVGQIQENIVNVPLKPIIWDKEEPRDEFRSKQLAMTWNHIRTPRKECYSLKESTNSIRLFPQILTIESLSSPTFIGRRVQHINFKSFCNLDIKGLGNDDLAGMILLQNTLWYYQLTLEKKDSGNTLSLKKVSNGIGEIINKIEIKGENITIGVQAKGQEYQFMVGENASRTDFGSAQDGTILSSMKAGGFVGAYIGMYAASNYETSNTYVDFNWFEYLPLDE